MAQYRDSKKGVIKMKKLRQHAARILLSLMLTVAMVAPMAMPRGCFAAKQYTDFSVAINYTTAKTQNICGIKIYFARNVIKEKRIAASPTKLKVTGQRWSVKLAWTGAPSNAITGYYVLSRDINGDTWRVISVLGPKATTYTDKKAKARTSTTATLLLRTRRSTARSWSRLLPAGLAPSRPAARRRTSTQ